MSLLTGTKMTNFEKAFDLTIKHEGFYSNNPDDPGCETCLGISRRYFPEWEGWKIIDEYTKREVPIPSFARDALKKLAEPFYEKKFWLNCGADRIENTAIAMILFDCAVNPGVCRAVTFLQESLNLLNEDDKSSDIEVDGRFGNNTLLRLKATLATIPDGEDRVVTYIRALRSEYYLKKTRSEKRKRGFLYGWLKRSFKE